MNARRCPRGNRERRESSSPPPALRISGPQPEAVEGASKPCRGCKVCLRVDSSVRYRQAQARKACSMILRRHRKGLSRVTRMACTAAGACDSPAVRRRRTGSGPIDVTRADSAGSPAGMRRAVVRRMDLQPCQNWILRRPLSGRLAVSAARVACVEQVLDGARARGVGRALGTDLLCTLRHRHPVGAAPRGLPTSNQADSRDGCGGGPVPTQCSLRLGRQSADARIPQYRRRERRAGSRMVGRREAAIAASGGSAPQGRRRRCLGDDVSTPSWKHLPARDEWEKMMRRGVTARSRRNAATRPKTARVVTGGGDREGDGRWVTVCRGSSALAATGEPGGDWARGAAEQARLWRPPRAPQTTQDRDRLSTGARAPGWSGASSFRTYNHGTRPEGSGNDSGQRLGAHVFAGTSRSRRSHGLPILGRCREWATHDPPTPRGAAGGDGSIFR